MWQTFLVDGRRRDSEFSEFKERCINRVDGGDRVNRVDKTRIS